MGKCENCVFFGNYCSHRPRVGLSIQMNELMKLNVYKGKGRSSNLAGHSDFKIKTCFS